LMQAMVLPMFLESRLIAAAMPPRFGNKTVVALLAFLQTTRTKS
jgi:hypothetical protein